MGVDRWFRFYEDAITHDKVRGLANDTLRWQWVIMLTVASKYGGSIPSLKVAALNLNTSEAKAAQIIATLHRSDLLDRVEGGYFKPHDWHGRQPTDATAAIRMRKLRERQRNNRNGVTDGIASQPVTVTATDVRSKIDDDGEEKLAAAKRPWELEPCHDLARRVAEVAGCADEFEFTGWGGATYRVKQWIDSGWPQEIILSSVRDQAARKRDGPARTIQYFERGIASAIAKANQPIPNIVELPARTIEVRNGNSEPQNSLSAVSKRAIGFFEGQENEDEIGGGTNPFDVRLLSQGGGE